MRWLILAILYFTSCSEELGDETVLVTEDILYTSGRTLRVSGRILSFEGDKVEDHGFHISKNEKFNEFEAINLGGRSALGRFIGEATNLVYGTVYYVRAYASVDGKLLTGNTILVETLVPGIDQFYPKYGDNGTIIHIRGRNFSPNTRVFLDDQELTIDAVEFESFIAAKIPPISNNAFPKISVQVDDTLMTFNDPFEYTIGKWEVVTPFINNEEIDHAAFFKEEDQFIFGLGRKFNHENNPVVWALDLTSFTWQQIAEFQHYETVRSPFSVPGYIGSGAKTLAPAPDWSDQLWQYSGSFTPIGSTPFSLYKSVGVRLKDSIYVFGGENEDRSISKNIYMYDINSMGWQIIGEIPFNIDNTYAHYIYNDNFYIINHADGWLWEFNVHDFKWSKIYKFNFPLEAEGVAHVIDRNLYFGLYNLDKKIWEMNLDTYEIREKLKYPASSGDITVGHFMHNNKIYFLRKKFANADEPVPMELWSFDPFNF